MCAAFSQKMLQKRLAVDPLWGHLERSSGPLAGFKGWRWGQGKGRERDMKGGHRGGRMGDGGKEEEERGRRGEEKGK